MGGGREDMRCPFVESMERHGITLLCEISKYATVSGLVSFRPAYRFRKDDTQIRKAFHIFFVYNSVSSDYYRFPILILN